MLFLGLVAAGSSVLASLPYRSYTYDYWGEPVPAPHAYVPTAVINGSTLESEICLPQKTSTRLTSTGFSWPTRVIQD